jgi:hypothetical protein
MLKCNRVTAGSGFFLCGPCQGVILKTIETTQLVVTRDNISDREAVNIQLEGVKLKNLHC